MPETRLRYHAGARRAARRSRWSRCSSTTATVVGARRLPRRRRVLRPQRLPDHHLLLAEWTAARRIDLPAFWLPARPPAAAGAVPRDRSAVVVFAGVFAAPADVLQQLRGDAFATLGYVANWQFIVSGQSYFDQFAQPSPLRHMWSLAIEEQFYLVWPLVVLRAAAPGARLAPRAARGVAWRWSPASAAADGGALPARAPTRRASTTAPTRRAQSLLIGAVARAAPRPHGPIATHAGRSTAPRIARQWVQRAPALAVLGRRTNAATWLYRGGLPSRRCCRAVIDRGVTAETAAPLGRVLSLRPVRWIGVISYGLYLWHWPVYVALSRGRTRARRAGIARRPPRVHRRHRDGLVLPRRAAGPAGRPAGLAGPGPHTPRPRSRRRGGVRRRDRERPRHRALPGGCERQGRHGAALATPGSTPPPAAPGVVRGVLIGDWVAFTLGVGFEQVEPPTLTLENAGVLGCGVIRGDADIGGTWTPNPEKCERWSDTWPEIIRSQQAQVVVAFWGAWDMFDRRVNGQVMRWGTPELDQFLTSELDHALGVLTSTGARVVLLTAPYYEPPDLASRVDRSQSLYEKPRVDHWNDLLRSVAQAHQDSVSVVDLHAYLDPNGASVDSIAGVDDIRYDGIHFTPQGADVVARWLSPKIVGIARQARPFDAITNASVGSRSGIR